MTQSIGPPSLAQGTRIAVGFSTSISRFIPACGELSKPSWAIVQLDGSSPLARGTHPSLNVNKSPARFIPAYAGNSILDIVYLPNHSVHPRLRGELNLQLRGLFDTLGSSRLRGELFARKGDEIGYTGSSPLTRGTRAAHRIKNRFHRFIPAYAGNSAGKVLRRRSLIGSSRLRGELRGKI